MCGMKAHCLIREDFSSLTITYCFLPPSIPSPSASFSALLSQQPSPQWEAVLIPPSLKKSTRLQLRCWRDCTGGKSHSSYFSHFLSEQCRWPWRECREGEGGEGGKPVMQRGVFNLSRWTIGGGSVVSELKEPTWEAQLLKEFQKRSGGISPREALE